MSYRSDYEVVEPARMDIDAAPDLVLLEFGAPWCGHCQAAQPALRALLDEAGNVIHVKVEDGRGKPLGRSFGVKLWPTVLVLRQGEELARAVRPVSAADLAPLRQALQGEGGQ